MQNFWSISEINVWIVVKFRHCGRSHSLFFFLKRLINGLRPVSVLPVLRKLLEEVVYKQLTDHLITNKEVSHIQSAFRKSCTTATTLIKVTNEITKNMNEAQVTYLALQDYSKTIYCIKLERMI